MADVKLTSERPPLRLSMNIETPDGYQTRWASTEENPLKVHSGLTFTTTMPGGFEHLDVTLTRDPRRLYSDLRELERITIYSVGGDVVWQGRLETIPSVSGDQLALSPGASGYQSALTDDNSARELYVENDLTQWETPTLNRQTYVTTVPFDVEGSQVTPNPADPVNPYIPALATQFTGSWTRLHSCEGWYDTQGLPIGFLLYQAQVAAAGFIADEPLVNNWVFQAGLCNDDALATSPDGGKHWVGDSSAAFDATGNFAGTGPTFTGRVPVSGLANSARVFAFVQLYNTAAGGTDGVNYPLYWRGLTLIGQQGLPLYDSDLGGIAHATLKGVLGSDVLNHCIPKYVPEIAITSQGISTIAPSTFVIPELVFLSPATVSDIIKQVSSYELQDWAVWEGDNGPCFYWYPRTNPGTLGMRGRLWRSRIGPAQFQSTGPQIDRLYNGVIISFTDFAGISRTVGPGNSMDGSVTVPLWAQSGCSYTDPSLVDLDPQNPINQWGQGIRKWAPLSMTTTSTVAQAIVVGAAFLQEQKVRNQSGSAQIAGYVEDAAGVTWPAFAIRAGDQIAFVDAPDPSYRRVVSTSYDDDAKINSLTLDTPPDSLQAMLSRLQVTLTPIIGG